MAKIVNMKGTGVFSKGVIGAVKNVAKKVAKRIVTNTKRTLNQKRKRSGNPSGRSRHHVAAPKGISKRMRKQRG